MQCVLPLQWMEKAHVGHVTGLVGLCKEKSIFCLFFHCITHQDSLCGKIIRLSETVKIFINIVNLERGGKNKSLHTQSIYRIHGKFGS